MSEITLLWREYEHNSEMSRSVTDDVIQIKRVRYRLPGYDDVSADQSEACRARLRRLVGALAERIGFDRSTSNTELRLPEALVERVRVKYGVSKVFARFESDRPVVGTPFTYNAVLAEGGKLASTEYFASDYVGTITFLPGVGVIQKSTGSVPVGSPISCKVSFSATDSGEILGTNRHSEDYFACRMVVTASRTAFYSGTPISVGMELLSASFSRHRPYCCGRVTVDPGVVADWTGSDTPFRLDPQANGSVVALHFKSDLLDFSYFDLGNAPPWIVQNQMTFVSTNPVRPDTNSPPGWLFDTRGNTYFENFATISTEGTFTANLFLSELTSLSTHLRAGEAELTDWDMEFLESLTSGLDQETSRVFKRLWRK